MDRKTNDMLHKRICRLPSDLQGTIWKRYYSSFLIAELLVHPKIIQQQAQETIYDFSKILIIKAVNALHIFAQQSPLAYMISLDFLEDRMVDDGSEVMFGVLLNFKHLIHQPSHLAMVLQEECTVQDLYSVLGSIRTMYFNVFPDVVEDDVMYIWDVITGGMET